MMTEHITIENYLPQIGENRMRDEIMAGLTARQKYILPKYFYDTVGSELFEEITALEEYYPTRTEKQILSTIISDLQLDMGNKSIIELGSGDPSKITLLLKQIPYPILQTINYYPVDICESEIIKSVDSLTQEFSLRNICGIVADFHHQLHCIPKDNCRLFCFFGSTIGNFSMEEAQRFLNNLSAVMNPGDQLLLGVDIVKDISILERAYNDSKEVTARFNLNILNAVNRIMGTNFSLDDFYHKAHFNKELSRIEMHLYALRDMVIAIEDADCFIEIKKGETIHTENSHKFTPERIQQLCDWGGFSNHRISHDPRKWFGIVYATK